MSWQLDQEKKAVCGPQNYKPGWSTEFPRKAAFQSQIIPQYKPRISM